MQFEEAMSKYGIDKPDTRYALYIKDITSTFQQANTSVKLFKESIQQGHRIKCINFKSLGANVTNEDITTLVNEAKKAGAKVYCDILDLTDRICLSLSLWMASGRILSPNT